MPAFSGALGRAAVPPECELSQLLHGRRLIREPRWRASALLGLAPAALALDIDVDWLDDELRLELSEATGAPVLTGFVLRVVDAVIERRLPVRGPALRALGAVAWARGGGEATLAAVAAGLGLGAHDEVAALIEEIAQRDRGLARRASALAASGVVVARGARRPACRFVGRIGDRDRFPPSLAIVVAMVDAGIEAAQVAAYATAVAGVDRAAAAAQVARARVSAGLEVAMASARAIRERSVRDGARWLIVDALLDAGQPDAAVSVADTVEATVWRQRAQLAIAAARARAGDGQGALGALETVCHRTLAAERACLVAEILAAAGRVGAAVRALPGVTARRSARPLPTWLGRPDTVSAETRIRAVLAVVHALVGESTDVAAPLAAVDGWLVGARRHVLELGGRAGLSPRALVTALREQVGRSIVGPMWAEHLALRGEVVAADPRRDLAYAAGRAAAAPPEASGTLSWERTVYDEGLSRSAEVRSRRRALVAACRRALHAAMGGDVAPAIVESRLRTLLHLGGDLGIGALRHAVARERVDPVHHAAVIDAVCVVDPAAAARAVVGRASELRAAGVDPSRALSLVEDHGGLPDGFARAWPRAIAALGGEGADDWLGRFARAYERDAGQFPPAEVLLWIGGRGSVAVAPERLVSEHRAAVAACFELSPLTLASRLATDAESRELWLAVEPARVGDRMRAWSGRRWQDTFGVIASDALGAICARTIARCARRIGHAGFAAAVAAGDLGACGVSRLVSVDDTTRLRLLDKRRDLPTYLRFADNAAASCYRSDHPMYDRPGCGTRRDVLTVWKDPLAWCFHIERRRGDRWRPCGFVFGGFAEVEGAGPAVVANGVYVRPRTRPLREGIVRALEQHLCAPLGIARLGIASEHGGSGPLPCDYDRRPVVVWRWRALRDRDGLVQHAYDDISFQVNARHELDHLFWKEPIQSAASGAAAAVG